MPVRAVDDKPSDTLVVVSGEGFWTGSSTLPHLHHARSWGQAPNPGDLRAGPATNRMNGRDRRYLAWRRTARDAGVEMTTRDSDLPCSTQRVERDDSLDLQNRGPTRTT